MPSNGLVLTTATAAFLAASSVASASTLNLTAGGPFDVPDGFIAVNYNATSHLFSASAFDGTFSLTASISNAGVPLSNVATLSVTGTGGSPVNFSSNSLFPSITNFASGAVDRFEFIFQQTSGVNATAGSRVGVILSGFFGTFPGNTPSFASNFSNVSSGFGQGTVDTFPVPAPATALLGLGLLASRRRTRSR
jgi:hypothetical protein